MLPRRAGASRSNLTHRELALALCQRPEMGCPSSPPSSGTTTSCVCNGTNLSPANLFRCSEPQSLRLCRFSEPPLLRGPRRRSSMSRPYVCGHPLWFKNKCASSAFTTDPDHSDPCTTSEVSPHVVGTAERHGRLFVNVFGRSARLQCGHWPSFITKLSLGEQLLPKHCEQSPINLHRPLSGSSSGSI